MGSLKTDALSNLGTSKVFLCIVNGISNPKAIAKHLEIKPPPVIQQLRRLQKLGIIKLGEKIGKIQNYEIDWNNFLDRFLDNALKERQRVNAPDSKILLPDRTTDIGEIKVLKTNKYFRHFVELYLKNCSPRRDTSRWPTIADVILNVDDVMPQLGSFRKQKSFEDSEKQEFFDKMRLWYDRTTTTQSWMQLQMSDAIAKTLKS